MANREQGRAARWRAAWRRLGVGALLGVLTTSLVEAPRRAEAAVTLEAVGPVAPAALERALVIHDAYKGVECLVQDFTFPAGDAQLGMLLPVPARPTVSKLASSPFAKLAAASAALAPESAGSGFGSSGPEGLTRAATPAPSAPELVQVGKLTTSVIAASDTKALERWLAGSKLTTDAATVAWLKSYAARGFYFVAVRVTPAPKPGAFSTVTETLQIRFDSALPFFPYAEATTDGELRLLSVWLLSSHRHVPVSLASVDGKVRWIRPWHEVDASRPALRELQGLLPPSLLALVPPGPEKNGGLLRYPDHQLQHFEDQKSRRLDSGDVVLVRERPQETGLVPAANLRRVMNVLDPEVQP